MNVNEYKSFPKLVTKSLTKQLDDKDDKNCKIKRVIDGISKSSHSFKSEKLSRTKITTRFFLLFFYAN